MDRNCDGCTKCCEGHLIANIYGYKMYPGKPCHFVTKNGCSIYSNRPVDPCKGFKCAWKRNSKIPFELKPDSIGLILLDQYLDDIHYISIVSAGSSPSIEIIEWAIQAVNSGDIANIVYRTNGQPKIISHDPDFVKNYKDMLAKKTA